MTYTLKAFPVMEIFGPVIQGEGVMVGTQTMFVRFGGCGYRCSWCDSLHAVLVDQIKANAIQMDTMDIIKALQEKGPNCKTVTLSGGNPLIHNLSSLVNLLSASGYHIAVETQGDMYRTWADNCSVVTISPKGPSSGMVTDYKKLNLFVNNVVQSDAEVCIKIVVFNEHDYEYAIDIYERYKHLSGLYQWYIQPGTNVFETNDVVAIQEYRRKILERTKEFFEKVCNDPRAHAFKVVPQVHSLVFGHKQGV